MLALLPSSWLPLAALFLSGMLVKWLLDLFFLRRAMFDTQEALLTRERQITDLRHELNRSVETLKNRTTELDATVKAKSAADALAAQRMADQLAASERHTLETEALKRARSEDHAAAATLRDEVQGLLGHLAGERSERRSAESAALDLRLRLVEAESQALDHEAALRSMRTALGLAASEAESLRPLLEESRRELAAQVTVNRALQEAVRMRDTTLEGLRTQLASAEAEIQSVSQLLARQDADRDRLAEVEKALTEAEARCTSARQEADATRLQLEAIQNQRIDFDSALMLKEAQANAWEREYRNAKNRADGAASKAAHDAQAIESLKSELAARCEELEVARAASATPTVDPSIARRLQDLESELATVSESHARLEAQLAEAKAMASRAEDLSEQLGNVEAELAALKVESAPATPAASGDLDTLLQDLDSLTRERNLLAAEVASLKASGVRSND